MCESWSLEPGLKLSIDSTVVSHLASSQAVQLLQEMTPLQFRPDALGARFAMWLLWFTSRESCSLFTLSWESAESHIFTYIFTYIVRWNLVTVISSLWLRPCFSSLIHAVEHLDDPKEAFSPRKPHKCRCLVASLAWLGLEKCHWHGTGVGCQGRGNLHDKSLKMITNCLRLVFIPPSHWQWKKIRDLRQFWLRANA